MERRRYFPESWKYFLIGVRPAYFEKFGPSLLVFYLGYPAAFTILVFLFHWGDRLLFLATLIAIFIIEVVFTGNPLLMSFPQLLIGIPLSILVYAPLTFSPLWIVRKEAGRHKWTMAGLAAVEIIITLLTAFGAP
jgi:hypothetical protein